MDEENVPGMTRFIFNWKTQFELLREGRPENDKYKLSGYWITGYNVKCFEWNFYFSDNCFGIAACSTFVWKPIFEISYTLNSDNDMKNVLYSSPKFSETAAEDDDNIEFDTPDGFFANFDDAYHKGIIAKMSVRVELIIPSVNFFRPFDLPLHPLNKDYCSEYPTNMENDFRLEFLNESDYSIKCPNDYSVPALKMVLNVSSKFIQKHLKQSKENELIVEHSVDVVKPVIYFLHSICFRMPQSYNLDFADRLLQAVDFFDPLHKFFIENSIEKSLCCKFVEEISDFPSLFPWIRISNIYRLISLLHMICDLIANKYYDKWIETFPDNENNSNKALFIHYFGREGDDYIFGHENLAEHTFRTIRRHSSHFPRIFFDNY